MVDMRGRNIAFSSDLLLQGELPLRVLTRCEERQQPATVPDRLFEGLPPSTKCDGFFALDFSRDLRCHDSLLLMWEVLAVARRTIIAQVLNHAPLRKLTHPEVDPLPESAFCHSP